MTISDTPNGQTASHEIRFVHHTGVEMMVRIDAGGFTSEAQNDEAAQDLLDLATGWDKIHPDTTPYAVKFIHVDYSINPTPTPVSGEGSSRET